MDLENLVMGELKKKFEGGDLTKIINNSIDKLFADIMADIFNKYGSPIKEALVKKLNDTLLANIDRVEIEPQIEFILQATKKYLDEQQQEHYESIKKMIEDFYDKPKEKYNLTELMPLMIEDFDEDMDYFDKDNITLINEDSRYPSSFHYLYIDEEPNKEKHRCEHCFLISDSDTICSYTRKTYNGEKSAFELAMERDKLGGLIHKMITHKSKLEVDL